MIDFLTRSEITQFDQLLFFAAILLLLYNLKKLDS
jgi:hypothetical protein